MRKTSAVAALVTIAVLGGCQEPREEKRTAEAEARYADLVEDQGHDLSEIYEMDLGDVLTHDRIMRLAISSAWEESSDSERSNLCESYAGDRKNTLDFLTGEGMHGDLTVEEQQGILADHFEANC